MRGAEFSFARGCTDGNWKLLQHDSSRLGRRQSGAECRDRANDLALQIERPA